MPKLEIVNNIMQELETFFSRLSFLIDQHSDGKYTIFAQNVGIPISTFKNIVNGQMPKAEHLMLISEKYGISIDWLLNGEGEPYKKEGDEVGEREINENPVVTELLKMTREIVSSDTVFASSLAIHIRTSHRAMNLEREVRDHEKRIAQMEQRGKVKNHEKESSVYDGSEQRHAKRRVKDDPSKIPNGMNRRSGQNRRKTGTTG